MKSIAKYGKTITELSEYVKTLDESVRAVAFDFLITQEVGHVAEAVPSVAPAVHSESRSRAISPQELIRKCGVSAFTEVGVVLAYWLETHKKQPTFTSVDLRTAFEQARQPAPKNPSDLVAKLESTGRIMKVEAAGPIQHYRLTSTAIDEAERWLNQQKDGK